MTPKKQQKKINLLRRFTNKILLTLITPLVLTAFRPQPLPIPLHLHPQLWLLICTQLSIQQLLAWLPTWPALRVLPSYWSDRPCYIMSRSTGVFPHVYPGVCTNHLNDNIPTTGQAVHRLWAPPHSIMWRRKVRFQQLHVLLKGYSICGQFHQFPP